MLTERGDMSYYNCREIKVLLTDFVRLPALLGLPTRIPISANSRLSICANLSLWIHFDSSSTFSTGDESITETALLEPFRRTFDLSREATRFLPLACGAAGGT